MSKSKVRLKVEEILGEEIAKKVKYVFVDATNPAHRERTGYRMKLSMNSNVAKEISTDTLKEIGKLPHVTKVKFNYGNGSISYQAFIYDGLCIYFDKKPSTIIL